MARAPITPSVVARTCIIPVIDPVGNRQKCSKPVVTPPPNSLCAEHLSPVSDEVVARYINQRLAAKLVST